MNKKREEVFVKAKRVMSALLVSAMTASMFTGCGDGTTGADSASVGDTQSSENEEGVKEFTAFFAVPGTEINDDNEIQEKIAEITGVKVKETWLTGQKAQEAVGTLIAGGEYPDFIDGGDGMAQLYDAGALIPLDDYIDKYPNIKEFLTEQEWDKFRMMDIFIGSSSSAISTATKKRPHTMTRHSGFRRVSLSGQAIPKYIPWISILI